MKLSICIDAVYEGVDFIEALNEVASTGVRGVEFWSWWDKDIGRIHKAAKSLDMTIVACCTRFVSLVDSSQRATYLKGLRETIAVCQQLGCTRIISQVGDDLGIDRKIQQQSLIDGLKASATLLEGTGITLVFEPLNIRVDHAGYYLTSSDEAFAIVDAVANPNIKVTFDIYHQQITEGDLIRRITANMDKIGHFHAAGTPGRHELDSGELNYQAIFDAIVASDYSGYVGLEYFPEGIPIDGIKRLVNKSHS